MIVLGIDAGASSTRWLLQAETGQELAQGKLGPLTGHIFKEDDRLENRARLDQLIRDVLAAGKPGAVAIGMTGLHPGTEAARFYETALQTAFALEARHVELSNDMHIAYASVFEPGEGVLAYAGTGAVGYHETEAGVVLRSGGYGYLIDDAGAGYWIGHEGIKQVMRWVDETGQVATQVLAQVIYDDVGSTVWPEIMEVIYGGGRSRVAALAPKVALAAKQGDEAALEILERAGQELARLANCILGRLGKALPVTFAGGISRLSPVLTQSLERSLKAHTAFKVESGEPVQAAAKLAFKLLQKT
ncbi:MAG: hypothetical protein KC422_19440 [Trueperaceae bacterium]|nr:hypothetical protein [Trueperaceae bacterium]